MAFFTESQLADIQIERMVFHIVGRSDSDLIKLQELKPGKFAKFFIDRIRSVNFGVPYLFKDASSTRERLNRILKDGTTFQVESEALAEEFQSLNVGSAATGALLIFLLKVGSERLVAILKTDDETVLTYDLTDEADGRKKATLDNIERTFVQNNDALQKSALIRLTEEGGSLIVLDRRNQQKVARYFENFLQATREFDDAELTTVLVDVTRKLIKANQDLVTAEVYAQATKRTFEAASAGGEIDGQDQKSFLDTVLGQKLPSDHPLVAKYNAALNVARISGMPVTLTPQDVAPAVSTRYRTNRGIDIRVPAGLEKLIEEQGSTIIIKDTVKETYDDTK
ncbi:nucleoid-associated protein [Agrobacterium rhizogenes]|nr:nucleoid-associated protein [Rhizobium rhizogenes]